MMIYHKDMKPVNLNNVDYIDFVTLEDKRTALIRFRFTGDFIDWKFTGNFDQAVIVYNQILDNFTELK